MNKIIVAIGGGENGRTLENGKKTIYDTKTIDEQIDILRDKGLNISNDDKTKEILLREYYIMHGIWEKLYVESPRVQYVTLTRAILIIMIKIIKCHLKT